MFAGNRTTSPRTASAGAGAFAEPSCGASFAAYEPLVRGTCDNVDAMVPGADDNARAKELCRLLYCRGSGDPYEFCDAPEAPVQQHKDTVTQTLRMLAVTAAVLVVVGVVNQDALRALVVPVKAIKAIKA